MRGQLLRSLYSLVFTFLCLGTLLTTINWHLSDNNDEEPPRLPRHKKSPSKPSKGCNPRSEARAERAPHISEPPRQPRYSSHTGYNPSSMSSLGPRICWTCTENLLREVRGRHPYQKPEPPQLAPFNSKEQRLYDLEVIAKVKERYSQTWKKQEQNSNKFRSELSSQCNGFDKAIMTQANSPIGSKIMYTLEKRSLQVTPKIHSIFAKEHPFPNKTWETCAVVGNGGILTDSSCGKMIDSAQFVIRCNLPPLEDGYDKDVGTKTDLVTANPSILIDKYGALMGRRRLFVERLRSFGNSLMLLSAFSFGRYTSMCQRALYSIEDLGSPIRPIFLNPDYFRKLTAFWRSKGLKASRLSSGIMMISLALELCDKVDLYGFWPFGNHPQGLYAVTHHYYDNAKVTPGIHAMPAEFDLFLRLHSQGVLRLHLEDCRPGEM